MQASPVTADDLSFGLVAAIVSVCGVLFTIYRTRSSEGSSDTKAILKSLESVVETQRSLIRSQDQMLISQARIAETLEHTMKENGLVSEKWMKLTDRLMDTLERQHHAED